MKKKIFVKFLMSLVVLLLTSFVVEAKKVSFKSNKKAIEAIKTVYVVTDSMLMEHYNKNDVGLDPEFNFDIGKQVFKSTKAYLAKHFDAKFIHAGSAVGLYPEGLVYVMDANETDQQINLPAYDKTVGMIDEKQMIEIEKIEPLFERMHRMPETYKEKKAFVPDMLEKSYERVQWLNLQPDEAVLMVSATGLRKRPKGSTGKTVAAAVLTLGMGLYIELAPKYFHAGLVDAQGKLLWVGRTDTTKGISQQQIRDSLFKMYKTLPFKIKRLVSASKKRR